MDIEWKGLERIGGVRHSLVLELLQVGGAGSGMLVIHNELADTSAAERFRSMREEMVSASPGPFPADELLHAALRVVRDAAEALDYIHEYHDLQHLDVKPTNLLLVGDRCKLGDFSTVAEFTHSRPNPSEAVTGPPPENADGDSSTHHCRRGVVRDRAVRPGATLFTATGAFTPRYAPPEAFVGRFSRSFDQYSLALSFCELVSGRLPFSEQGESQVLQRQRGELSLDFLPAGMRPTLARALSPKPEGRFPSCLAFVRELQRSTFADVTNDEGFTVHDRRGRSHLEKGEHDQAVTEFTEAIALRPTCATTYYLRAKAAAHRLQYRRMIKDLTQAIALGYEGSDAYLMRGRVYLATRDHARAIEDLTEAIRRNPNDAEGHRSRGHAHFNTAEYALAVEDLSEAIRLEPNDAGTYRLRGSAHMKRGDYACACEDIGEAIRLDQAETVAYSRAGVVPP
jgi:tetratricopeptide (TPR) repeat protein